MTTGTTTDDTTAITTTTRKKANGRKKGRRAHGEGSIQKRSDGRYVAVVDLGLQPTKKRHPDGRVVMVRKRRSYYGSSREEVAARLKRALDTIEKGISLPDEKTTTAEYLAWWLDTALPGTVRASTAHGYRNIVNLYIVPNLGAVPLAKLAPKHITQLLADLSKAGPTDRTKDGMAPRSVKLVKVVLGRALGDAVGHELISRNPAVGVRGPKIGRRSSVVSDAPTREEAVALLDAIAGHPLEGAFRLMLQAGLRRGEALGIQWADLDFREGTVTVRRTIKYLPGQGIVADDPKTDSSAREVALVPELVAMLRALKVAQAKAWRDAKWGWVPTTNYVFVARGTKNNPIDPPNALRAFQTVAAKAGLGERRRLHSLRHGYATLAREAGIPLEEISEDLGHSDYAITANVYARVRKSSRQRRVDILSEVFTG